MSTSLKEHGFCRENASKAVVALTSKERAEIKLCKLSWNERLQCLEAVVTFTDNKSGRFSWDFDAKAQRQGLSVPPSRLNRLDGYNDRYVLTDRPVDKKEA